MLNKMTKWHNFLIQRTYKQNKGIGAVSGAILTVYSEDHSVTSFISHLICIVSDMTYNLYYLGMAQTCLTSS